MSLQIDHVIYGTRDMNAVAHRWWEEHGLASYEGGFHPQYGTGNRIVPLGDSYIEIMGIVDDATAQLNPLGLYVLEETSNGDRWIAWCLRTSDIDGVAARIGSTVVPGERRTPDGGVVSWRLTGLEIAISEPPLPFFISWDDPATHPGRAPLEHRCGASGIARVTVGMDAARLGEHLAGATLPVEVAGGDGLESVVVATADGELILR